MAELLLVSNPHRRRRKNKHRRKGRMPAALKKYWAAKRRGKNPKRRRHKARHHRRARAANPHRRKRHHKRRRNMYIPNPHRRHRRKRNPGLSSMTRSFMPTVEAGAWGAGGGLALDILWGMLTTNLPSIAAYLANPYLTFLGKAAGAIAVGTFGGHLAKGHGRDLAVGAMTVTVHDFVKAQLLSLAPTIFGPGGALAFGSYLSRAGAPDYLGSYLSGAAPIMGTATIPQAYLPFSGSSGMSDGNMYTDDRMGLDPWS